MDHDDLYAAITKVEKTCNSIYKIINGNDKDGGLVTKVVVNEENIGNLQKWKNCIVGAFISLIVLLMAIKIKGM